MEQQSLLIGRTVEYSRRKGEPGQGLVLCKIDMREHGDDTYTITGYMIQDVDGTVASIAHWRILKVIQ